MMRQVSNGRMRAALLLAAVTLSLAATSSQASARTSGPGTVAATLAADGKAWETGLRAYLVAAPHCFTGNRTRFAACLNAAFAKWHIPFAQARYDVVVVDIPQAKGACKERLLDYLGPGGTGDALITTMGFAQKDARERKLNLLSQTLQQLTLPAFGATNKALKAAEAAC